MVRWSSDFINGTGYTCRIREQLEREALVVCERLLLFDDVE
jgi:hypothetical protein